MELPESFAGRSPLSGPLSSFFNHLNHLRCFLCRWCFDFTLAPFHFFVVFFFAGHLFGALLPTVTIPCQILPLYRSNCRNTGGFETAVVPAIRLGSLYFHHVLGLSSFGTLDYFKFHFLLFCQGAETFALDGAVMHKDIRAVFPSNEAEAL